MCGINMPEIKVKFRIFKSTLPNFVITIDLRLQRIQV